MMKKSLHSGRIVLFFCFLTAMWLLSGCGSLLYKKVQLSTSVHPVSALVLPEECRIRFVNPEIKQSSGFRGMLMEAGRRDYFFYDLPGDGISITRRENFLLQPFQVWYPNLNIEKYFRKLALQKNFSDVENAIPLSVEVALSSLSVDKRRGGRVDADYTWKLKLYIEGADQKRELLGEKDFKLSSQSVFDQASGKRMPPVPYSGKTFTAEFINNFEGRDSGYHTRGQDLYNSALEYSILHGSLDIINRNAARVSACAKQRRDAVNAGRIERHWAVVVGVSKYKNNAGGLNDLTFADNDARAMVKVFHERLNWPMSRIKLLVNENATKSRVMEQIDNIVSKMGENDMLTIYWSGHGFVNSSETYFACYDTDVRNVSTALSMARLRSELENKKVNNVFFIADTCHAGALATGTRGLSVSSISNNITPVKQTKQNQGWIFMLAAESDRQAVEDKKWGHGAFTYFILKGLNGAADGYEGSGNADKIITPAELRAFLRHTVPFETQKSLGTAVHPLIHTNSANAKIWDINIYEEE